jgi:Fe-Mn family superoxide dismutase
LVGGALLLPLDVFEHAFLVDYGAKRVDYINAFMQTVNWNAVEKRFIEARQKTD